MITPAYATTATERVLPRVALDFTTAALDARVTITRAGNTATAINSSGVIALVNANLPRFDYNPSTLVCKGLLVEESRTNLLLNSLIDGTSLSTQIVTTTAVAHTLSFYGTGQIVLAGASSATVVGGGAYPTRTTLTFTPIVGALTLTVTGAVQYAQLEVGAFVTSFIPTAGAAVARNSDIATMTGANFSSWFNASEGTLVNWFNIPIDYSAGFPTFSCISDGTTANRIVLTSNSGGNNLNLEMFASGSAQAGFYPGYTSGNTKVGFAYKLNNTNFGKDGVSGTTDTTCSVPTSDRLNIGSNQSSGNFLNGYVQKFFYYPQRLTNAELAAFSK
jgi:hypothetical protein